MTITRAQFIRGFNTLKADWDAQSAIEDVAIRAGRDDFNLGNSPVRNELERQLVERCRAREDDDGPWPEDSCGEDDISLALHWAGQPIHDEKGNVLPPHPSTAEDLWDHWEATSTGPFRPVRGQVIDLSTRRPK